METPNIIYIYADDLGKGLLSCYGQQHYETPNIDKIARGGMKFTRAYANAFCAPARASLLCGIHDAHAGRWSFAPGNVYKKVSTGEYSVQELDELIHNVGTDNECKYLAEILREKGYVTGEIGKLEWGFSTCNSEMVKHGWDYHYGYYDHGRCHGFYPPFLFENGSKIEIEGNSDPHCGKPFIEQSAEGNLGADMSFRQQYSQDLFDDKMMAFIEEHKDEKFFLYHPSQLPHGPTFYPQYHSAVKDNENLMPLEKEYASMVLRLDDTVGKILDRLEALNLTKNTLVIFASDNGHENSYYMIEGRTSKYSESDGTVLNDQNRPFRSKTCGDTFNGNDGLAGLKFSNWDGGNRIVLMAQWPGIIPKSSVCNKLISNYDTAATFAELVSNETKNSDGISYLSFLKGDEEAEGHDYIVFSAKEGPCLVTKDGYKLRCYISEEVRVDALSGKGNIIYDERFDPQLYNVLEDPAEERNIARQYPEIVKSLLQQLLKECDGNLLHGTPQDHHSYLMAQIPSWPEICRGAI